jgi:hypothetical protein
MADVRAPALILGVLATVACSAPAWADDGQGPTVHTSPAGRSYPAYLHRAVIAFGHAPCGSPSVLLGDFVDADVAAGADPVTCSIYFNAAMFARMPKPMRCTLFMHEYGHLAGRPDSDQKGSVMYRYYTGPDPRCHDA